MAVWRRQLLTGKHLFCALSRICIASNPTRWRGNKPVAEGSFAHREVGQRRKELRAWQRRNPGEAATIEPGARIVSRRSHFGRLILNCRIACRCWRDELEADHAAMCFFHRGMKRRKLGK